MSIESWLVLFLPLFFASFAWLLGRIERRLDQIISLLQVMPRQRDLRLGAEPGGKGGR
jgi:hypothetical protein